MVDNHSPDQTDQIVQEFSDPRIKLLKIHNNGVIAASRNMSIREAKGEWIAYVDSDDWWTSNKLNGRFFVGEPEILNYINDEDSTIFVRHRS